MTAGSATCPSGADLSRACELLSSGDATVAAVRGDVERTSGERGVRPLMAWVSAGVSLEGFAVADKVVGKAPALLYCLLLPSEVYAPVMSRAARELLERNGIRTSCGTEVERILNANGTGQCPIDASVEGVEDPEVGLETIRVCLKRLAEARQTAARVGA